MRMKECPTCGGAGKVRRFTGDGYKTAVRTCETCHGDGMCLIEPVREPPRGA